MRKLEQSQCLFDGLNKLFRTELFLSTVRWHSNYLIQNQLIPTFLSLYLISVRVCIEEMLYWLRGKIMNSPLTKPPLSFRQGCILQADAPSRECSAGRLHAHPVGLGSDWPANKNCDRDLGFHSGNETPTQETELALGKEGRYVHEIKDLGEQSD